MDNKINWVTISNPRDQRASYQRDRTVILGDINHYIRFQLIHDPAGWLEGDKGEDWTWELLAWKDRRWSHKAYFSELDYAKEAAEERYK